MADMKLYTAFPTYVGAVDWNQEGIQEFNQRLTLSLYRKRSDDPEGIFRSNAAGTWHSDDHVLTTCGKEGKTLGKMFYRAFSQWLEAHAHKPGGKYELRLAAWAMMYRAGGYAAVHTHPNCHVSGVYYVDAGKAQEPKQLATNVAVVPGSIEFIDTRGGIGQQMIKGLQLNPSLRVTPESGKMLVFPSGLPHWVHPVVGEGERIAVACNATIMKYTPPTDEKGE